MQPAAKAADTLGVEMKLCLVQVLTANQLVQIEESRLRVLANEGKTVFSLATICSSQIESTSVGSLIGTPSLYLLQHEQSFFFLLSFALTPNIFTLYYPRVLFTSITRI